MTKNRQSIHQHQIALIFDAIWFLPAITTLSSTRINSITQQEEQSTLFYFGKNFQSNITFVIVIWLEIQKISSLGTQYCPVYMLRRTCISCTWAFFCYYCITIILQQEYKTQYWLIYMFPSTNLYIIRLSCFFIILKFCCIYQ